MRKVFTFTIIFFVLFLGFQLLINYLKTEHSVEYLLEIDDKKYSIVETYDKTSDVDYYFFEVKFDDSDVSFLFEVDNSFNKQVEVVKDVKKYTNDNLICLSLVYINDEQSDSICMKDGVLHSASSVVENFDDPFFVKSQIFDGESEKIVSNDLSINKDYFYKNEILLVYNYKNVFKFFEDFVDSLTFSTHDNYKNELGFLVGKYYMVPKYFAVPEFSIYWAFDIESGVVKEINLPSGINKNSYVMGVYDNKLYLFDKSSLIQYSIDPYTSEVIVLGDINKEGIVLKNGVFENISVYTLAQEKVLFEENVDDYEGLSYDDIFISSKYAIYVKGNNFYKVYSGHLDNPIFLFSTSNFKEVKVINDKVYYIVDDTLYRYDNNGTYPLLSREEFKYNYSNIYDIYMVEE